MAYFALLWKARTIEKYRLNYERQKLNSVRLSETQNPKTSFYQKLKLYNCNLKKKVSKKFQEWYPEGSTVHGFFYYSTTDQTFPNFVLKSVIGFVGGVILTYLCFMFFVFQLAISLIHATIMSSVIGVLLTLGLAFSYRIRCLVFLLIPQFFSRVGRYTLTCYALVLILTGPATNTLKNSEVLSESMACKQEQIKSNVALINESLQKPFNALKESIQMLINNVRKLAKKMKTIVIELRRLVISLAQTLQATYFYLDSVAITCNRKLGTPYEMCTTAVSKGVQDCQAAFGARLSWVCNLAYVAELLCISVKPLKHLCVFIEYVNSNIVGSVEKRLNSFSERMQYMLKLEVHFHHSYTFSSNSSRSASQVAAGVVTEIRRRADPLLTWLSWSSCVTSLFLLLIIFRAKHYQHMFETRSRFDNRYITKELRELDLKRMRQGRETVLPLNRRERAKYITTTSFRLVSIEKNHLSRSAVFMVITTFKLLIHIIADYSLYWILITIRYRGRFQTPMQIGTHDPSALITGSGLLRRFFEALLRSIHKPLETPPPSPVSCLPDPHPPDLQRYAQIGILIMLLWFFAMFEPYGLRLRHVIMGMYRPERAKARAVWLYNHIQRTRCGYMKFARRKLHRENKYSSEARHTLQNWLNCHIPCGCLKSLLGICPEDPKCLLCGTREYCNDPNTNLIRCLTPNCPGTFCVRCSRDIGDLCTICLSPADYGDMSDISLEKGSSEESDEDDCVYCHMKGTGTDFGPDDDNYDSKSCDATECTKPINNTTSRNEKNRQRRWKFTKRAKDGNQENAPLLDTGSDTNDDLETPMKGFEKNYKQTSDKDKYPNPKPRKIKCKHCFTSSYCNCENNSSSLCLLKAEFIKAMELATGKAYLKKRRRNFYRENVKIQCQMACGQLGVQTSSHLMPQSEQKIKKHGSILKNGITTENQASIENSKDHHPKSLRRRNKCSSKIPCSTRYEISYSNAHILVSKTFRVTKPARRLRSKCKLIFRCRKPKKTIFGRWFLSLSKRLRGKRRILNRLSKGDYRNINKETVKNENTNKTKSEKVGDKNVTCSKKDGKNSLEKENTESPNKIGRNKRLRLRLVCKKYGDYFKRGKYVSSADTSKIVSFFTKEESSPFESDKTNFKRRKKLLKRRDKIHTEQVTKHNSENTRKYRISSYLSEQEWMKRRHMKDVTPRTSTKIYIDLEEENNRPLGISKTEKIKHNNKQDDNDLINKMENLEKLTDLDVQPSYLSESRVARSAVSLHGIQQKLFNSMEVGVSSSSSNFLSYTDNLLAAEENPPSSRKFVDSSKYNATQTLDYDLSRSMNYYRSIGLKDFDENDEDLQKLHMKRFEKLCKANVKQNQEIPSRSFDHASLQDFVNDCNEGSPLVASQTKVHADLKKVDEKEQQDSPKNKENKRKVSKQFPRILSPLSMLYSCLFGRKRNVDDDVELIAVDEEVSVYPIVKSCACQHFGMDLRKDPIETQPTKMDAQQSMSHEALHDAEINAVNPTCTCATQFVVDKREACTFCKTKHHRNCKHCKDASTAHYESHFEELKECRDVGTVHMDCLKKKSNHGVQCKYYDGEDNIVYTKPKMSTVKFSPQTSRRSKSRKDSKSREDKKSPKTKSYIRMSPETNSSKQRSPSSSPPSRQVSETDVSSESSHSEGTKTDTTVCSLATIQYLDETPKRVIRRRNVEVVTKANRATVTDAERLTDAGTVTGDWWSPILERKSKRVQLPRNDVRAKIKNRCPVDTREMGVSTDGKVVTFKSYAQIIPASNQPPADVMSPSRYLLESQRYYNELYNPNPCPSSAINQAQIRDTRDSRQQLRRRGFRPKRLDSCYYSPRDMRSPRKVKFEEVRHAETGDRERSQTARYTKHVRYGVTRSKSAHKQSIREKESIDLKRAENNLHRGCVSSDHVSLDCHCNSEDTSSF